MELDAYQEGMPVEYTEGGTMVLNVVECADEASKSPLQFAIPDEVSADQPPSYSGHWIFTRSSFLPASHISDP
jgi:hypothetical protein